MTSVRLEQENQQLDGAGSKLVRFGIAAGVLGFAGGIGIAIAGGGGMSRFYQGYLVNYAYFLSLALGALFFVLIQHVTKAGWSVAVRRVAEGVSTTLALLALLFVPIVFGMHDLFEWTHAEAIASDELIAHKTPYLNPTFFVIRWVFYFVVWIAYSSYFWLLSRQQDESGDPRLTRRMERHSTHGVLLFALTLTFAAFDLLMSLDPHWFSTIFGVYYFAGGLLGFFSLLAIMLTLIQRSGRLSRSVHVEHYHDIGKFMFGFTVFWAYIAFSQYMLIWYADIPEETGWYLRRQTGQWLTVSNILILGHFVVPFLALLSRVPKRRKGILVIMAAWILVMHWIDIYWLAMPEFSQQAVPLSFVDLALLVGLGGLLVAFAGWQLGKAALIPLRDPRLDESIGLQNL
ncbi:MAG: quinol:cytochrome C oxidoreductase [Acidobacteriota bacterium]|nr:MAG: quinol:cytochrome C oxidoreductase [Acidobacteriota bacterium]